MAKCKCGEAGAAWMADANAPSGFRCVACGNPKPADALGFEEDHSIASRRRGRDGRSISHSYGGEGRNYVD